MQNTVLGNFAKAGEDVSGAFTSLNIGRLIDRAAAARDDADKARIAYRDAITRLNNGDTAAAADAINALAAYMEADQVRGDAQDDIAFAQNTQNWVNAGAEGLQLWERLAPPSGGGFGGMGGGAALGVGIGGGLLLSSLIDTRRSRAMR